MAWKGKAHYTFDASLLLKLVVKLYIKQSPDSDSSATSFNIAGTHQKLKEHHLHT